jgi:hypothetical protein
VLNFLLITVVYGLSGGFMCFFFKVIFFPHFIICFSLTWFDLVGFSKQSRIECASAYYCAFFVAGLIIVIFWFSFWSRHHGRCIFYLRISFF